MLKKQTGNTGTDMPKQTGNTGTELIKDMNNSLTKAKGGLQTAVANTAGTSDAIETAEGFADSAEQAAKLWKRDTEKIRDEEERKTGTTETGTQWIVVGVVSLIVVAMLLSNAYLGDNDYDDDY
eukprot:232502_1